MLRVTKNGKMTVKNEKQFGEKIKDVKMGREEEIPEKDQARVRWRWSKLKINDVLRNELCGIDAGPE